MLMYLFYTRSRIRLSGSDNPTCVDPVAAVGCTLVILYTVGSRGNRQRGGFIFIYQGKFWAPHLRDTIVLLKELTWNDSTKFARNNVTTTHERMLAEVLGYCSRTRGFQLVVFGINRSPL